MRAIEQKIKDKVVKLYQKGYKLSQIQKEFVGYIPDVGNMRDWLKKAKVELRDDRKSWPKDIKRKALMLYKKGLSSILTE